jgi:HEAT repeat protein
MSPDTLAAELNDPDTEVRLAAIRRVSEPREGILDDAALDALVHCLGAPRKIIQRRAAEALATLAPDDSRVVEKLRAMLSNEDARARWGAVYALGLVNLDSGLDGALDLRAMPTLMEALSSGDGDIRWAAAELVVRLGTKNPDAVRAQLMTLARDGNLNARKMALYCLRDVPPGSGSSHELLAVAEACCAAANSILKMAALSLISRIADCNPRASGLALRMLESDPDAAVRRCAAVALGHIGHRSDNVIEALRRAARGDEDIFLKRSAQGALKRLGHLGIDT